MITHGMRKSKEYEAWQHMIQRCTNPKNRAYKNYGGRGIKVCERWMKFENFIADVGLSPSKLHTLDRYPNNDGNYEPGNTRWATTREQSVNKRSVHLITHNGETMCLTDWAKRLGIDRSNLMGRINRGWDIQKAVSTPSFKTGRKRAA